MIHLVSQAVRVDELVLEAKRPILRLHWEDAHGEGGARASGLGWTIGKGLRSLGSWTKRQKAWEALQLEVSTFGGLSDCW